MEEWIEGGIRSFAWSTWRDAPRRRESVVMALCLSTGTGVETGSEACLTRPFRRMDSGIRRDDGKGPCEATGQSRVAFVGSTSGKVV